MLSVIHLLHSDTTVRGSSALSDVWQLLLVTLKEASLKLFRKREYFLHVTTLFIVFLLTLLSINEQQLQWSRCSSQSDVYVWTVTFELSDISLTHLVHSFTLILSRSSTLKVTDMLKFKVTWGKKLTSNCLDDQPRLKSRYEMENCKLLPVKNFFRSNAAPPLLWSGKMLINWSAWP